MHLRKSVFVSPVRSFASAIFLLTVVSAPSIFAQTESFRGRTPLPGNYMPQQVPPRWNSNVPSLTSNPEEGARVRTVAPPWLSRFLVFPSPGEISDNLGKDDPIIREKAALAITQALAPSLVPDGMPDRLIPMARWGQLHEDWRRYGGVDLYICKFTVSNLTIFVAETATHVIIIARDTSFVPPSTTLALRQTAFDYANILLSSALVPDVIEDLRPIRQGVSPNYYYGYYNSRLNKLTGRENQTTLTETSDSATALSVRFFAHSQVVAFMALKSVDDPSELGNPFEPRFVPIVARPDSGAGFVRPDMTDLPGERQLEEYLGMSLSPKDKSDFLGAVSMEDLEGQFLKLSREQQIAMVRLKMTDEYLAAGMKAFLEQRFADAIQYWTRNIQLEPENPRAGLLLNMAIEKHTEKAFNGDIKRAAADTGIFQAKRLVREQQVALSKREETKSLELAKERAMIDHRTKALQAMSEGNFEESLKQWESILKLEPGNANAQVFRELVRSRMEKKEYRSVLRRLPSARPTPKRTE
jgi:tetratricopeptide (TPR) repeat protein